MKIISTVFNQFLLLVILVVLVVLASTFVAENIERQNIASGLGFLDSTAGFEIREHLIEYAPQDTYGRAFLVGLLNTILVSAVSIVLASIFGLAIGIALLSSNWLVAKLADVYVQIVSNIPVLVHIFVWYFAVFKSLPPPRQSLVVLDNVFLTNRGMWFPKPVFDAGFSSVVSAAAVGIVASIFAAKMIRRRHNIGENPRTMWWPATSLVLGIPVLTFFAMDTPLHWEYPVQKGFSLTGGVQLSIEFVALTAGLSLYNSAFIAKIVQATASEHGQRMRATIPALANRYLNITKDSSLGAAIAYPDLVMVFAGTTLMQTGQVVEILAITAAVFLGFSSVHSMFLSWHEKMVMRRDSSPQVTVPSDPIELHWEFGRESGDNSTWTWRLKSLLTSPLQTIIALYLLYLLAPPVLGWSLIDADFEGSRATDCTRTGACWVYIEVWFNQLMFGRFPDTELWRIFAAFALLALPVASLAIRQYLLAAFVMLGYVVVVYYLLMGDMLGLEYVETALWGGAFLSLTIFVVVAALSLPLGVLLAFGERSSVSPIRSLCIGYLGFFRGVPLLVVLFAASVFFPLLLPEGIHFDKLTRAMIGFTLFSAAYMAEPVRAALETQWVDQAPDLVEVIEEAMPAILIAAIGILKSTTLVMVIGLFELFGMAQLISTNPDWLDFWLEGYVFVAFCFWLACFSLGRLSDRLRR